MTDQSRSLFSAEPDVWPNITPDEFARVKKAVCRLAAIRDAAGYWTPIGKVVETLAYAHEPGEREWNLIDAALDAPTPPEWEHRRGWRHCSPDLLAAGVSCASTPRRPCECFAGGSHDHLVRLASETDGGA